MRQSSLRLEILFVAFALMLLSTGQLFAQRAEQGAKPLAKAHSVMVSSSHPTVTKAMLDVLKRGGNAVDAMITAIPLQHVIEPQMSTFMAPLLGPGLPSMA